MPSLSYSKEFQQLVSKPTVDLFQGTSSRKIKMSKREVPKLNREKFVAWKTLMKLHLRSIGDYAKTLITVDHVDPTGPLTVDDLSKKENNQAMLEIALAPVMLNMMTSKDVILHTKFGKPYQLSMEEMIISREPKEKA